MKKILFGLVALSLMSTTVMAKDINLYLKAGADIHSEFDQIGYEGTEINSDENDKLGYELALELTKNYGDFEFGLGIAYQDHGEPKVGYRGKDSGSYDDGNIQGTYKDNVWTSFEGYKSIPLYLTGKYNFKTFESVKTYLKLDLGYSFNFDEGDVLYHYDGIVTPNNGGKPFRDAGTDKISVNIDDGLYLGFGVGLEYNNFVTDLMYKVNKAEIEYSDEYCSVKRDMDYSRITLSFGYKFNF